MLQKQELFKVEREVDVVPEQHPDAVPEQQQPRCKKRNACRLDATIQPAICRNRTIILIKRV
jgi:hypothetical protein